MSDFAYRLAYVVICCAVMLGLWFAVRWLVYGMSDDFVFGALAGGLWATVFFTAAHIIDQRNRQR